MTTFLLSNDDGYGAQGIAYLREALQGFGEVFTIAPDRDRSGASQSLTLHRPIRVRREDEKNMVAEGTPADCVHLGLSGLIPQRPDWVISGINHGANMGSDVLYSGTVAAAMEGACLGIPAVAFSLAGSRYYETAMLVAKLLMPQLLSMGLPKGTVLSVNTPDVPMESIKGISWVRLGNRDPHDKLIPVDDPRGGERYWIGLPGAASDVKKGTDFHAIAHNKVALTLLSVDRSFVDVADSIWPKLQTISLQSKEDV